MMDVEDNETDDVEKEAEVSHAEMRAMLWGRQRQSTESVENSVPNNEDSSQCSQRASRPTSLSDEWKELTRIRSCENTASRESIPELTLHTKKSIWKNFLSLCTGLMLAFMSFLPLRNIQTSIYLAEHLGSITLATIYISFMIGSLISPWLVQNAKPKGLLLLAISSHIFFVTANLLPSFYTLLPAASLFGFLQAPLWSVQELLIGSYGTSYSTIAGIRIDKSIRQFQSVFVVFCHSAQIFGNLIESGILNLDPQNRKFSNRGNSGNISLPIVKCFNASDCRHQSHTRFGYQMIRLTQADDRSDVTSIDCLQILIFVYLALACFSMSLIGLCLRKPDIIINKRKTSLMEKLVEMCEFMKTKTFVMTVVLMVFTGMQQALVIGDVTRVCCIKNRLYF